MNLRRLAQVVLIILLPSLVLGQADFTTTADKPVLSRGQLVQVEYTILGAKKVEDFAPPSFRNFSVMQGPLQASGPMIINGNLIEYVSFAYILQPKTTGKLIIPGATAIIDGKKKQSQAISVEVISARSPGSTGPQGFRFNLPEERVEADRELVLYPNEKVADKVKKNLFVKVEVSKKECYVNEPVIATYKLYSRLRSDSRVVKRPSFNGFSVYNMTEPGSSISTVEKYNGRLYNVHVISKSQLFPLQTGEFVLDPAEIEAAVQFVKAESEMDSYLEQIDDPTAEVVEHTVTIASTPVEIDVKPLPASSQPAGFDGAVGDFSVTASLNNPVVKAGEAAKLTVEIRGKGNIPMINAPAVNWPGSVEPFDPTAKEDIHVETAPLNGVKTFEYAFTPKDTGNIIIPPVRFSYFDPATGSYKTDSTRAISLRILPGENKQRETKKDKAIAVLSPSAKNIWLWMGIGAVATLLVIALVVSAGRKKHGKFVATVQPQEPPAPAAVVRDPLAKAKHMLNNASSKIFVKEVESVVWMEAGEKLKIQPIALNQASVIAELNKRGASESTIQSFRQLMYDCESALYIPGQTSEDLQGILDRAEGFLSELDKLA
ncbi:MAG TPA: BatD family protein [Chitinophagaceae bacterium]|nr:BatD family protein [Chitinophagaceae bacterium]